jgi:RNA polymerase sigma factor (sigma-70 family)
MSARLRAWFRSAPVAASEAASDGDLVRRFADTRDDTAFAELVRRHGPMVLATCRRVLHPDVHTADDAFQAAFLVLATRAAAVSPPERVGAFLHGVAVLVAKKARAWARKALSAAPADLARVPAAPSGADPDAADVRAKIDDVLAGLPSKYRSAVVLCDLEQRSRKEAAAALGWSEGALSGRLARARKLLADRLARRGVAAPAALVGAGLGGLLPASAAPASVPAQLAASTLHTAALVAAGAPAGEAIPAPVAALAQGVSAVQSATVKLFAAGLACVGLALAGFGLYALTAADPPAPPAEPVPAAAPAPAPAVNGWTAKHTLTHKHEVRAVALGADVVASGDKGGVLALWDAKTGAEKEVLLDGSAELAAPIDRIQMSPDGAWLYLVTTDGKAFHQCSVEKKDRLFPGAGTGQAKTVGVTADGSHWVQVDGKRTVGLVENRFAENLIPFMTVARFVHKDDIDFTAAGDTDVVATVAGGVLRRWDKGDKKPVWEEKLEKFEVSALAVCPVSKVIAAGGKGGEVRVYGALTGKVLVTLRGHSGAVTAIAFSADGTRVVTGGADGTGRVWDAETGKELAELKGHAKGVTAVAFGPDGDTVATGGADKTVRVWAAPADAPKPAANGGKDADKVMKLLRGKWRVTKMTVYKGPSAAEPNGDLPTVAFAPIAGNAGKVAFDGVMFARDALMLRNPGRSPAEGTFDLGAVGADEKGADPKKALDLTILMSDVEGSNGPEVRAVRCFYAFDGEKLRLAMPFVLKGGAPRPTGFDPQTADEARKGFEEKLVLVLEREKP